MRTCVMALIIVSQLGCVEEQPDVSVPNSSDAERETTVRADTEEVLDAVLKDILNNPDLKHSREFYGTPNDTRVALVSGSDSGTRWPVDYRPRIRGVKFVRVKDGEHGGKDDPKLLGVRIDKLDLHEKPSGRFNAPVRVTLFNAGGWKNGAVIGGCIVYYVPKLRGDRWGVDCTGSFDP